MPPWRPNQGNDMKDIWFSDKVPLLFDCVSWVSSSSAS
jgi:hypothetical protein